MSIGVDMHVSHQSAVSKTLRRRALYLLVLYARHSVELRATTSQNGLWARRCVSHSLRSRSKVRRSSSKSRCFCSQACTSASSCFRCFDHSAWSSECWLLFSYDSAVMYTMVIRRESNEAARAKFNSEDCNDTLRLSLFDGIACTGDWTDGWNVL